MILLTSRPSGLPHRCSWGHPTCWTTSCACVTSYLCLCASVFSQAVSSKIKCMLLFSFESVISLSLHDLLEIYSCLVPLGIPFMYRGLPCIYSSAILASASLLSGGNMTMLRVIAMAMILFMISQNFYPHDRVLESQAWKKAVYAGGKAIFQKVSRLKNCQE